MRQKFVFKIFNSLLLALLLIACVEDGPVGPQGPSGNNGKNGATGATGATGDIGAKGLDGLKGVGYDDAISMGNVRVTFSGTRPDNNEPFTVVKDYKFSAPMPQYSKVTESSADVFDMNILRYSGLVDDVYQDDYIRLVIRSSYACCAPFTTVYDFDLNTFLVLPGAKYIYWDSNVGIGAAGITEYAFDKQTGDLHMVLDFVQPSGTVPGISADTDIHAEINVTLFKLL